MDNLDMTSCIVAATIALLLALVGGKILIPFFTRLKFGQEIRQDGPQGHLKKAGTPTMGGFIFIIPIVLVTLGISWQQMVPMLGFLGFAALGFADDYLKIRKKDNEGLTPVQKFTGQAILAVLISLALAGQSSDYIYLFSRTWVVDSFWIKLPIDVLVLLAVPNALNLTDGLDGLAATSSIPVFLTMALIASSFGQVQVASVSIIAIGALLGFLFYNRHPAKVFMGDSGSLALGGLIGILAIQLGLELMLLIICGLFVLETLSVILQVSYYKYSGGKRLFLMSPIHHHYELKGWTERKIVRIFSLVSLMFCLLGILVFL
jgi:phospho-N-acetylmuramoyl-pentapeptide-transferase